MTIPSPICEPCYDMILGTDDTYLSKFNGVRISIKHFITKANEDFDQEVLPMYICEVKGMPWMSDLQLLPDELCTSYIKAVAPPIEKEKKVRTSLHHEPTDIVVALKDFAGQEGNDGEEYDLMQEAAIYIRQLRLILQEVRGD